MDPDNLLRLHTEVSECIEAANNIPYLSKTGICEFKALGKPNPEILEVAKAFIILLNLYGDSEFSWNQILKFFGNPIAGLTKMEEIYFFTNYSDSTLEKVIPILYNQGISESSLSRQNLFMSGLYKWMTLSITHSQLQKTISNISS